MKRSILKAHFLKLPSIALIRDQIRDKTKWLKQHYLLYSTEYGSLLPGEALC